MGMFEFLRPQPGRDHFHAALERAGSRWYAACLRITCDARLAEDAVQDALLRAWDKRGTFRGDASLDTWIHRIALNCALELVRRRGSMDTLITPDVVEAAFDDSADFVDRAAARSETPDARLTAHAIGEDVERALSRLSGLEREAFCLKHIEGWSLAQIASQQGSNVNNTKQALFRAVRKLRVALSHWKEDT
jgi:RNA polymerase sigma-70 factor (ECF subfamily)